MNFDAIQIIPMMTDAEIDGKAYVHWKSWQETYTGLIDQTYLDGITLEKCTQIAHRWKDNILVAKDGEHVVGFVAYGAYRDSALPNVGEVFAIYVLFIFVSMIKSKRFFTALFLSVLQGVCALFAVNLLGQYISIHIPINGWTIGVSSVGGISGVIMMLLCDGFMV